MTDPWNFILLAFGGNAVLLAALVWLARSLGSQLLAKDIEKFKSGLAAESAAAAQRLEHDLKLVALEHQVQFSKLHERRADVIAELYGLLVETEWAGQTLVAPLDDSPKAELYVTARNRATELYRYFCKNRIYLPADLCEKLEQVIPGLQGPVIRFGVYVSGDEGSLSAEILEQKINVWMKAVHYFNSEVPEVRSALEKELRLILGPSSPQRDPASKSLV